MSATLNHNFAVCIATLCILVSSVHSQEQSPPDARPVEKLTIPDLQMIEAIKDIRRQVGGLQLGIQNPSNPPDLTKGNSLQPGLPELKSVSPGEAEQQFDLQLRRHVATNPNTANEFSELGNSTIGTPISHKWPMTGEPKSEERNVQRWLVSLRSAARFLDLAAADLEDASDFETADQLRERARQIRESARKLDRTGQIQSPRRR